MSTAGSTDTISPAGGTGTCASSASTTASPHSGAASSGDPLVMYVLVRKDLDWPMGALMNQACHACTAVAWEARNDPQAAAYFSETERQMITYSMGASDVAQMEKLAGKLQAAGVPHRVWTEQPEDVPTSLATWPRRKSEVQKCFNGIKRF